VTFSVQDYTPGQRQRITVTVSDPAARRWGFELSSRPANALEQQAGTFEAVDGNAQVICDGFQPAPCAPGVLQFATHTRNGTRLGRPGPISFDIDWVAPSTDVGEVIFAAAGNAANGSDTEFGDNIYTTLARISGVTLVNLSPAIGAGGVVGAGLNTPLVRQLSPNGIFSIFGTQFAPEGTLRGPRVAEGRLTTNLGGACVEVAGARAPMFFVSPGQINAQAPSLSTSGSVPVTVILNCGTSSEIRSNAESVPMQAAAPEFFLFPSGAGGSPIAATNAVTGAPVGGPFPPAKPGDFVALYATGLGATSPAFEAGVLPGGIAQTTQAVIVTLGGRNVETQYAGVAPGFAGLYQINIQIPADMADGSHAVVARAGNTSTPPGAILAVQR
jgi:uncharacterized protein (TIGR03437 family)